MGRRALAGLVGYHAAAGILVGIVLTFGGIGTVSAPAGMHCPDPTVACGLSFVDAGASLAGQAGSGVRNR